MICELFIMYIYRGVYVLFYFLIYFLNNISIYIFIDILYQSLCAGSPGAMALYSVIIIL